MPLGSNMSTRLSEKIERSSQNPLCLDAAELKCLSSQVDLSPSQAGYFAIYGYANTLDKAVMMASSLCAIAAGAAVPLLSIFMGSLIGKFSDLSGKAGFEDYLSSVRTLILYLVYIGIVTLVCTSLFVYGFTWTGQRISTRIREAYLDALLRQNIAYLDSLGVGEVTTRIAADMNLVQDGISQKVGLTVNLLSAFVTGLVIAFFKSWRLALPLLGIPLALVSMIGFVGGRLKRAFMDSLQIYASTASFAEEAISSLRNVAAYGLQRHFVKKYDASLVPAAKAERLAKTLLGILTGGAMGIMLSSFALAPWAGSLFYETGTITLSELITALFAIIISASSFAGVFPNIQAFATAAPAANRVFASIERNPSVESDSIDGVKPGNLRGHINFKDLKLVYPSRANQIVMDGFNLDIPPGKTTAVVGPSGSGKSSLFYLLQAFYLPLQGNVSIDDYDIKDFNLRWLRSRMRMVSQEPFLFDTTVFENIAFGLVGTELEHIDTDAKVKLVEDAAKASNAHDFICQLPQGYRTTVGKHGDLLSGGQRQRLAIARAIVSDPKILLLDEATASLDTKSESLVQKALTQRSVTGGRTTVVISHRLSTIRHADKIVVMEHGRITEEGTHEELLAKGGAYASLAMGQSLQDDGQKCTRELPDSNDENDGDADRLLLPLTSKLSAAKEGQKETEASSWELMKFLLKLNKPEMRYIVLGMIGSFFSGLAYPATAICFGNAVLAVREAAATLGGYGIGFWAGMQWLTAWTIFLSYVVQNSFFAIASSRLIARARTLAFAAILRQDMEFFSRPGNGSGALTAFLAKQANQLNGLSGLILGAILSSLSSVVLGFVVALIFSWKLGVVAGSIMPLIFITGFARIQIISNLEKKNLRDTVAASIVSESIRGIRTVAALGLEAKVAGLYRERLRDEMRSSAVMDVISSSIYGFSQSVIVFSTAMVFWYGGTKILPTGQFTIADFMICFMATTYSAQAAGGLFSLAPDVAGAKMAAARLKELCETVPEISIDRDGGAAADGVVGDVALRAVDFAYPSFDGKKHRVLRDLSLHADSGRFVALVGASGSGKSTVLNILERLYDPQSGNVQLDGKELREYKLQGLRKQMAIVEQDAVLYSGTVQENIVGDSEAGAEAIERACRDANIWEFVESLPNGVNTLVGPRGSQVSGGQKQRLAIARALLRNPKVLLLDEATSALDSNSEAVVQNALAAAALGRTTIAVAHRLSSIAHANCIYVFDKGAIVEQGTHAELMAKKGRYWEYVGMQNLKN